MSEVKDFVDAVYKLYPKEAPAMAQMAAAEDMGFGPSSTDYGDVVRQDEKDHSVF